MAGRELKESAGAEGAVRSEEMRAKVAINGAANFRISGDAIGVEGLGYMDSGNFRDAYLRAQRERPDIGFAGKRVEPSLDEARAELAKSISQVVHNLFQDRYGPLVSAVSEPAVTEFLKGFEARLTQAKGDVTLVAQELLDRVLPPSSMRRR